MELGEIIKDAVKYPTSNIKALMLYLVLGLLIGVVEVLTGITSITKLSLNFDSGIVLGIIGVIIVIAIALLMLGFSLDVIKFAIKRSADAPEIDLARQISNGLKYIIISIIYMIIPIITIVVLGAIFQHWIATILGLIVAIIFAFALIMAVCKLSKTDNLGSALDIRGVIADLKAIGIGKVIITIIAATIVGFIIVFILTIILTIILNFAPADLITPVVSIVAAILDAWLLFYENRVMGLLYSDIA